MSVYSSVDFTSNGVLLSVLTEFALQFESQGSRPCLSVRAETSSMDCGTDLKVSLTIRTLPRIPRGQNF